MADTLADWLEEWHREEGWLCSKAEVARLVDEIGRLREQNTGLGERIQESWKRIETLEQDPPADQQVDLVKAWGWVHVANYHDARPGRDGDGVKRCNHLDVDWCSQRDKGRMIPVLRPPIGATDA